MQTCRKNRRHGGKKARTPFRQKKPEGLGVEKKNSPMQAQARKTGAAYQSGKPFQADVRRTSSPEKTMCVKGN